MLLVDAATRTASTVERSFVASTDRIPSLERFRILDVADVNGDGRMEVAVHAWLFEGARRPNLRVRRHGPHPGALRRLRILRDIADYIAGLTPDVTDHQVSTLGRRGGAVGSVAERWVSGAASNRVVIQRRVSAGSITSSISKCDGDAHRLAVGVHAVDHLLEEHLALGVIGDAASSLR